MRTQAYWSWIDGKFLDSPHLPADSGGILHGYGAFETLYAREGKIFHLDLHYARLFKAAQALQLEFFYQTDEVESVMQNLLEKNALSEARLRVSLIARNTDYMEESVPTTLMISAFPYTREEREVRLLSLRAAEFNCPLSTHKFTSYAGYIRARREALQRGFDDALLLNEKGEAVECSTSNVFFWKAGSWHSPPLEKEGLRGIQYQVLTSHMQSLNQSVIYTNLYPSDEWEFGMVCNSLIGLQRISKLDERSFPETPPSAYKALLESVKRGL